MARKRIERIIPGYSTAPNGEPLALVVYRDRTYEYIPHADI
jgi:hypothetical protein